MATLNQTIRDTGATSNVLTAEQAEFYGKVLLERLIPELPFAKFATKTATIPKHAGDTISFRRINSLAKVTTPLVEGVTPEGVNLSVAKISAQVKQYGNYVVITDMSDKVALDNLKVEAVELLGENAGESLEAVTKVEIFGGSTVYRSGGVATQLLTATTMTYADILNAITLLKNAKVKKINGDYIAFVPIKVSNDIRQLAEWKAVNTYNHDGQYTGEIGRLLGVRFIEIPSDFITTYVGQGAGAKDVYGSLFIGAGYFGMPDVEGSVKPEIIIKEEGGTSDPLNQRMTVGFKNLFAVKRLNEACAVRVETL